MSCPVTDSLFICRCSQMRRKGNSTTLMEKMDSKRVTMAHTMISSPGWFHNQRTAPPPKRQKTSSHSVLVLSSHLVIYAASISFKIEVNIILFVVITMLKDCVSMYMETAPL